ncbi:MAG: hypothetical protein HN730_08025, partial [Bdellovibrionales bacterium]|nr:hypothetical protein [Bdellovibrionales bacterium]
MESLIKGLLSDDVEARIAARKQLMSLTSKEDIELFFKQIRGVEFGLDLYFDLAYLLSSIVVRGDIEQLPVAIKYLSFLTVHSNSKVVQRASVGLDYLFSSPELLLKYKYGVIKEVWPELQGMERGYLTNKIGEERMAILVNQLHENLSSDQSELVLQTVRALKMIKSYRSARHLSKVLHNSDLQVVREAIYGLGMIGGRGNYSAIRAKLELQDIPIVLAVVEVLPTLNPNRAVGDLKRVGMGDAAPAVKRRVMSKLADIGTLMAIIALLDLLAKYEDDPQITPNITWALQDISEKKKIDQIKRRFAASSVLVQIEMIRVLGMTDHPDCYNFLYDMIDPDEQSNVLISTLAALHRLLSHADKMPPVLLDLVEYSGPVGVAALELAIEYPDCDLNSLLLQIVHSSNGMEASILKGIFK